MTLKVIITESRERRRMTVKFLTIAIIAAVCLYLWWLLS
jgi:hypothetical protein